MKCLKFILSMSLLGAMPAAHGAIVYSGLQNIAVPYTFAGVYVNIRTLGTSFTQPADFNTAPWINLDFGGVDISSSAQVRPVVIGPGLDQVINLSGGFTVGPGANFASSPSASTTHLGPAPGQFQSNQQGYLGFSFQEIAGGPAYYGWMTISINDSGSGSGTIQHWAYEDSPGVGVPVGVPEPSRLILLVLGMGILASRRVRPH